VQLAMLLLWQVLQDQREALEAQAGLDRLAHKEFRAYKAMLAQQVHKEILVIKALQAQLERQAQSLDQQVRLARQAQQALKVRMVFHQAFINIKLIQVKQAEHLQMAMFIGIMQLKHQQQALHLVI
jgi:hypothetical protein